MSKAKDPAVLWYYQDYLEGTEEMPWAQQGAYARLLNKQAAKGHLSMEMIQGILKKDGMKLWPKVKHKFLVDEVGNFYNERMELELQKRKTYSKVQRDRINAYWDGVRNNHGSSTDDTGVDTTVYSTVKPIENGNRNSEELKKARHVGLIPDMVATFLQSFPLYPPDPENDYPACFAIAKKIASVKRWTDDEVMNLRRLDALAEWKLVIEFVASHDWYSKQSIAMLAKKWQDLIQAKNGQKPDEQGGKASKSVGDDIRAARKTQPQ